MKTILIILLLTTNLIFSQQVINSGYIALTNGQILEFQNLNMTNEKVTFYNTQSRTNYNILLSSVNWIKNQNGIEVYRSPEIANNKTNAQEGNNQTEKIYLKNTETNELKFMTCTKIEENGVKLTAEQLKDKFKFNSEILDKYNTGKGLRMAGNILFFGGLATLIIKGSMNVSGTNVYYNPNDPNDKPFNIMWLGVGGVVISIPLLISGKSQIKQAVDLYNVSKQKTTFQLNLKVNGTGLGLCGSF